MSALYFSMYLNTLFYYYVLLSLLMTIVMYYCILQAMYGPSLGLQSRPAILISTRLHNSRSSRSELEFDLSNFI